jgi:hypothetical protein
MNKLKHFFFMADPLSWKLLFPSLLQFIIALGKKQVQAGKPMQVRREIPYANAET